MRQYRPPVCWSYADGTWLYERKGTDGLLYQFSVMNEDLAGLNRIPVMPA